MPQAGNSVADSLASDTVKETTTAIIPVETVSTRPTRRARPSLIDRKFVMRFLVRCLPGIVLFGLYLWWIICRSERPKAKMTDAEIFRWLWLGIVANVYGAIFVVVGIVQGLPDIDACWADYRVVGCRIVRVCSSIGILGVTTWYLAVKAWLTIRLDPYDRTASRSSPGRSSLADYFEAVMGGLCVFIAYSILFTIISSPLFGHQTSLLTHWHQAVEEERRKAAAETLPITETVPSRA
ncbi:hypothetical protein PVAG01_05895 [Phlyctema vagabunda]|uniref:Uncharacterized protein n=1 Tax=Phlyctema vagabunda TaxID=108571 RepID=A0ABR4PEN5_9HELO